MTEKHEIQNLLDLNLAFWIFRVLDLFDCGFVSDFDIRISNFVSLASGPVEDLKCLIEVAGDLVTGGDLDEIGLSLRASRHDEGTARVEVAARRRVEGAGHLAAEDDLLLLLVGMRRKGGGEEGFGVRVQRVGTELKALGYFHDLPQIHHSDLLADVRDRRQIVGDEQVAHTQPPLNLFQQTYDVRSDRDVQRGHRLIEHDEPCIGGESTGDGQPLALAAAELMGKEASHVRPETDQLQQLPDPCKYFFLRDALVGLDRLADDLTNTHAGAERAVR